MLTKTNILSVQYFKGNADRLQFENEKQNVDVAPTLEKVLRTLMNDRALSLSLFVTFVLSLITNCLFLSVFSISVAK